MSVSPMNLGAYTITKDQWGDSFSWESSFVQVRGQKLPLMQVRDAA